MERLDTIDTKVSLKTAMGFVLFRANTVWYSGGRPFVRSVCRMWKNSDWKVYCSPDAYSNAPLPDVFIGNVGRLEIIHL